MIELLGFLGNSFGKIFEITYSYYYHLFSEDYDFNIIFEKRSETLRDASNISLNSFFIENINYI